MRRLLVYATVTEVTFVSERRFRLCYCVEASLTVSVSDEHDSAGCETTTKNRQRLGVAAGLALRRYHPYLLSAVVSSL